jgi:hypothetical protein
MRARCPMPLTFRIQLLLFFGFILLQAKGLSPGNADVLVGLGRPRQIYCRRGRQRSQGIRWRSRLGSGGDKGTDNPYAATVGLSVRNGAKTSDGSPQPRPPACESALRMEGEAVLSRKNTARTCLSWCHSCLSLCCPCPCCRYKKLVTLGKMPALLSCCAIINQAPSRQR